MSPADAEALEGALRASGADAAALGFVQRMAKLNQSSRRRRRTRPGGEETRGRPPPLTRGRGPRATSSTTPAPVRPVAQRRRERGQVPPRQRQAARGGEGDGGADDNEPDSRECAEYAWYDAKAKATTDGNRRLAPSASAPAHDHAVAFVMGGGNYLEAESVRAIAKGDDGAGGGGLGDGRGGGLGDARAAARLGGRDGTEERCVRSDGDVDGGGVCRAARGAGT